MASSHPVFDAQRGSAVLFLHSTSFAKARTAHFRITTKGLTRPEATASVIGPVGRYLTKPKSGTSTTWNKPVVFDDVTLDDGAQLTVTIEEGNTKLCSLSLTADQIKLGGSRIVLKPEEPAVTQFCYSLLWIPVRMMPLYGSLYVHVHLARSTSRGISSGLKDMVPQTSPGGLFVEVSPINGFVDFSTFRAKDPSHPVGSKDYNFDAFFLVPGVLFRDDKQALRFVLKSGISDRSTDLGRIDLSAQVMLGQCTARWFPLQKTDLMSKPPTHTLCVSTVFHAAPSPTSY